MYSRLLSPFEVNAGESSSVEEPETNVPYRKISDCLISFINKLAPIRDSQAKNYQKE